MVKDLALINPNDNFTAKMVCEFHPYTLRFVEQTKPLHAMLDEFKTVSCHLDYCIITVKSLSQAKDNHKITTDLWHYH